MLVLLCTSSREHYYYYDYDYDYHYYLRTDSGPSGGVCPTSWRGFTSKREAPGTTTLKNRHEDPFRETYARGGNVDVVPIHRSTHRVVFAYTLCCRGTKYCLD